MGKFLFWLAHAAVVAAWVYTRNDGFAAVLGTVYTIFAALLFIATLAQIWAPSDRPMTPIRPLRDAINLLFSIAMLCGLVMVGARYVASVYTLTLLFSAVFRVLPALQEK